MKQINAFSFIGMLFLFLFLSGCYDNSSLFIGTWESENAVIIFNEEYFIIEYFNDSKVRKIRGVYTVSHLRKRLTLELQEYYINEWNELPHPDSLQSFYKITNNELTLDYGEENIQIFSKISM